MIFSFKPLPSPLSLQPSVCRRRGSPTNLLQVLAAVLCAVATLAPAHAADQAAAEQPRSAPDSAPYCQSLNGAWELAAPGSDQFTAVTVPGLWNEKAGKDARDWPTATYRKALPPPAPAAAHLPAAVVEFDAISWGGEVLLNNRSVGTHRFGYTGCAFDLTAALQAGDNLLTVKPIGWTAIDRYPGGMTKIAVGAANWFGNRMGGIPGDVRLYRYDGAWIESFRVYPQVLGRQQPACRLVIPIHAAADQDFTGVLCVQILADDGLTPRSTVWQKSIVLKADARLSIATDPIDLPGAPLWSPATPTLHRARVWLLKTPAAGQPAAATPAAVREDRFGLREVAIKGTRLEINGQPYSLFGYTGVGAYYNFDLIADPAKLTEFQVTHFKAMNGVAFRCHQNPLTRAWLDLCDRHGVLVICEFHNFPDRQIQPIDTIENPYERKEFWTNFRQEIADLVQDRFNHPAIVVWSATNEGNGFSDWERAHLYPWVKQQDTTRPVMFSSDVTPEIADTHNFCGNWWGTHADFERIETDLAAAFPDRLFGCTEFGQYQFGANLYGEQVRTKTRPPEFDRDFAQLLMEDIEVLRRLRSGLILPFCVPHRPRQDDQPFAPDERFLAMKSAYAPLSLSLNRSRRHAVSQQTLNLPVMVYSDAADAQGDLQIDLYLLPEHPGYGWDGRLQDRTALATATAVAAVNPFAAANLDVQLTLPAVADKPLAAVLAAVLRRKDAPPAAPALAVSYRPLTIYPPIPALAPAAKRIVAVLEQGNEIATWLQARGHTVVPIMTDRNPDVIVIGPDMLSSGYLGMYQFMSLMRIKNGARLVILEQRLWTADAFANDLLTGLESAAPRAAIEALFPAATAAAQIGSAADFRKLNGLGGVALRTALHPPKPVAAAVPPPATNLAPVPNEPPATGTVQPPTVAPAPPPTAPAASAATPPPAAPAATDDDDTWPVPGAIPPAASPWETLLCGYSRGLKQPDIALARRTYEKGEVFACQIPLVARLNVTGHPDAYDPVAERLFIHLIESPR